MLTDYQIIMRLVLTAVLSGMIGLERQLHKRTAGLRTHILVSLGVLSKVFSLNLLIFYSYRDF